MAGMGDKILQSQGQSRAARQEGSYPDVVFIYFQVLPGISCGPAPLPCSGAVAGANSGISKQEGVLIKHASNLGCGGGWQTLGGAGTCFGGHRAGSTQLLARAGPCVSRDDVPP